MKLRKSLLPILLGCGLVTSAAAAPLSVWDSSWTQIASEDYVGSGGFVDPGWGGQNFDAEYLYYKMSGTELYLGLQTGFDVDTGNQTYGTYSGSPCLLTSCPVWYYSGDLALSFDGDAAYEYGVDFGNITRGYSGRKYSPSDSATDGLVDMDAIGSDGIDAAGFYSVSAWSNDVYSGFHVSDPFAMTAGTNLTGLLTNDSGSGIIGSDTSYYRIVSFDLSGLGLLGNDLDVDMHWTMSCGNDNINGGFKIVPEPTSIILLGLGLLGLTGLLRRRNQAI